VTFYAKLADGTTSTLGSAALSATGANAAAAKLSTNTLPAGADGLYAVYGGDDTYFSDTSPVVTETITTGKPAATANPTAVNFGSHALGTKTTKKVTLTSTGTSPLAVGTVASSGSPFTIGANSCTGHTLAPGQACSISVIFRPTAAAKSIGHLSITDNADSSPQSVTLSGTGVG
jgi:hypothetical protein